MKVREAGRIVPVAVSVAAAVNGDGRCEVLAMAIGSSEAEAAITDLVGAILIEQSEEWATQRARYMTLETIGPLSDTAPVSLPARAS